MPTIQGRRGVGQQSLGDYTGKQIVMLPGEDGKMHPAVKLPGGALKFISSDGRDPFAKKNTPLAKDEAKYGPIVSRKVQNGLTTVVYRDGGDGKPLTRQYTGAPGDRGVTVGTAPSATPASRPVRGASQQPASGKAKAPGAEFDRDVAKFGEPLSRPVVDGNMTVATFPVKDKKGRIRPSAPIFYGKYGERLPTSDPRVRNYIDANGMSEMQALGNGEMWKEASHDIYGDLHDGRSSSALLGEAISKPISAATAWAGGLQPLAPGQKPTKVQQAVRSIPDAFGNLAAGAITFVPSAFEQMTTAALSPFNAQAKQVYHDEADAQINAAGLGENGPLKRIAQGDVKGGIGQLIDKAEEDPVTAIATVAGGWHALKGAGLKTQEFYRDSLYARSKGWMSKSDALRKAGQTKEAYLALKKGMALRSAGDTVTVKMRAVETKQANSEAARAAAAKRAGVAIQTGAKRTGAAIQTGAKQAGTAIQAGAQEAKGAVQAGLQGVADAVAPPGMFGPQLELAGGLRGVNLRDYNNQPRSSVGSRNGRPTISASQASRPGGGPGGQGGANAGGQPGGSPGNTPAQPGGATPGESPGIVTPKNPIIISGINLAHIRDMGLSLARAIKVGGLKMDDVPDYITNKFGPQATPWKDQIIASAQRSMQILRLTPTGHGPFGPEYEQLLNLPRSTYPAALWHAGEGAIPGAYNVPHLGKVTLTAGHEPDTGYIPTEVVPPPRLLVPRRKTVGSGNSKGILWHGEEYPRFLELLTNGNFGHPIITDQSNLPIPTGDRYAFNPTIRNGALASDNGTWTAIFRPQIKEGVIVPPDTDMATVTKDYMDPKYGLTMTTGYKNGSQPYNVRDLPEYNQSTTLPDIMNMKNGLIQRELTRSSPATALQTYYHPNLIAFLRGIPLYEDMSILDPNVKSIDVARYNRAADIAEDRIRRREELLKVAKYYRF